MSMNEASVGLECLQLSKRVCKLGIRGVRIIVAKDKGDFLLILLFPSKARTHNTHKLVR